MLMQDEYKCFTQLPTIAILSSITTAYRPNRYNKAFCPLSEFVWLRYMNALCNIYKICISNLNLLTPYLYTTLIFILRKGIFFHNRKDLQFTCIYFLPWSLKTKQDWPGMIFVYVLNISQTFDTGVYFKPYYWFFKMKNKW